MSPRLNVVVILLGLLIFTGVIELVRKRMLREEYSFIWLMTGFVFVLIAIESRVLIFLSELIGFTLPVNMLFFLALIFMMLLCVYFSLRISALTTQVKNLAQQHALLQAKLESDD
jgi:hypothetical protein